MQITIYIIEISHIIGVSERSVVHIFSLLIWFSYSYSRSFNWVIFELKCRFLFNNLTDPSFVCLDY